MGTLILNSLEIKNFRGFRHLQIERLGRVNLIVGKNNVGKSSLLEALQIYARRGSPRLIREVLVARDEGKLPTLGPFITINFETLLPALRYLFYGRKDVDSHLVSITIGPINSPDDTLNISVGGYADYNTSDDQGPRLSIHMGNQQIVNYSLGQSLYKGPVLELIEGISCNLIEANGLSKKQLADMWDGIALKDLEKEVLAALRIITPGAEGLSLIGDPTTTSERLPIVKIAGIDEPLPLRSLGDGMQRMLGIALALVNTRDGMLLIDEIENGIHYSAQPELWQLIFQLAGRLNIQVFATTHNWDCIEAFQKAAQEDKQEEGMLIRLSIKKEDEVGVTLFDERKLGIATREHIEVR